MILPNNDYSLSTESLAKRWGLKSSTLDNWRSMGKGPVFTKIGGRVIYLLVDVIDYEQAARRSSTSSKNLATKSRQGVAH